MLEFGKNLQKLRENNSLSRNDLSSKIGITNTMIYMYEKMNKTPNLSVASEIAKYFGVSIDELCYKEEEILHNDKLLEFGKTLKEYRKANNITQKELSKITKIKIDTISRYEKGLETPTLNNLIKLSNFFEISIDEIIGRKIN